MSTQTNSSHLVWLLFVVAVAKVNKQRNDANDRIVPIAMTVGAMKTEVEKKNRNTSDSHIMIVDHLLFIEAYVLRVIYDMQQNLI